MNAVNEGWIRGEQVTREVINMKVVTDEVTQLSVGEHDCSSAAVVVVVTLCEFVEAYLMG